MQRYYKKDKSPNNRGAKKHTKKVNYALLPTNKEIGRAKKIEGYLERIKIDGRWSKDRQAEIAKSVVLLRLCPTCNSRKAGGAGVLQSGYGNVTGVSVLRL